MNKLKSIVLLILILFEICPSQAQDLYILTTDASQKKFPLSEIKEITFANRRIDIAIPVNTITNFPLKNLQFLSFKDYSGVSIAESADLTAIKLYPNPSADYLTLHLEDITAAKYELYDVNGKNLQQSCISSDFTTIDISNLPSAVYILRICEENKEIKSFKIIKK